MHNSAYKQNKIVKIIRIANILFTKILWKQQNVK